MVFNALNEFLWDDYATLPNMQTRNVPISASELNETNALASNVG